MKTAEINLEYQRLIDGPPAPPAALRQQSTSNDANTVSAWRDLWIANAKANHARFGSFKEHGIGKLWGKHQYQPVIVAGSGPSLRDNVATLAKKRGVPVVSCLHNFHLMEDSGVEVDYYVSLDAGDIVLEEVSEGGSRSPEEYWALTKNRTLLAYIGSPPRLFEKWQGKVYLFNCPVPDQAVVEAIEAIEKFGTCVSTGGNVLGASLYIAKGILGASMVAFVGADFSFSYRNKFHGWDSKYDKDLGQTVKLTDVYGIPVKSWQSYANFKAWFDWVAATVPGVYLNCSEGGCLGSYPEGNMLQVRPMDLAAFLDAVHMNDHLKGQCDDPAIQTIQILF